MSVLNWDLPGSKTYESGLDRGVFYVAGVDPFAWPGLISVEKSVAGGELDSYYWDGRKYLDIVNSEDYQGVITAFSAPAAFQECEGERELAPGLVATHQVRSTFHLTYRTGLGNDLEDDYGYKLHFVWNATASPSGRSYGTRSDSVDLGTRQWTIDAVPPEATTYKPTAYMSLNSTRTNPNMLAEIENILYGTTTKNAQMPTQAELISILTNPITEPLGAII